MFASGSGGEGKANGSGRGRPARPVRGLLPPLRRARYWQRPARIGPRDEGGKRPAEGGGGRRAPPGGGRTAAALSGILRPKATLLPSSTRNKGGGTALGLVFY